MKNLIYIFVVIVLFTSCKENKKVEKEIELTPAEKIANAHGYQHWKDVCEIAFTFNGKRHWLWQPKNNAVTLITELDTISYNRNTIDSTSIKIDPAFINDKFWLLIPFQLIWDKSATITTPIKMVAPISNIEMNKITLTYPEQGGYTPGDAYDIFYGNDYVIKEWGFRKGNKAEAGLITTFENYQDFNGLKLALDHKRGEGDWNLSFTNVKVIKQQN